jgi:DNA-binding beta-propeller fold protein YncE
MKSTFHNSLILTGIMALALTSCVFDSEEKSNKGEGTSKNTAILMHTSDYTTGSMRWLSGDTISDAKVSFNSDTKLVAHGKMLYVLERYGADNIAIVNIENLPSTSEITQVSLAPLANPMDLEVINDTLAWVALYGTDYLLQINPKTGKSIDSVSLKKWNAEGADVPYAQSLALYGDTLIVVLQRLGEDFAVIEKGFVVLLDAKNGETLGEIELKGTNPFDALLIEDQLFVGCQGSSRNEDLDDSKSLDVVDLKTGKVRVFTTAKDLGGSPTSLAFDEKNDILYVGSYRSWGDMPLASVNASTGAVIKKEIPGATNVFGGIVFDEKQGILYIGDQDDKEGGLKIWNGTAMQAVPGKELLPVTSLVVTHW